MRCRRSQARGNRVRNHAPNRIEVIYAAYKPTDEINSEAGNCTLPSPLFCPSEHVRGRVRTFRPRRRVSRPTASARRRLQRPWLDEPKQTHLSSTAAGRTQIYSSAEMRMLAGLRLHATPGEVDLPRWASFGQSHVRSGGTPGLRLSRTPQDSLSHASSGHRQFLNEPPPVRGCPLAGCSSRIERSLSQQPGPICQTLIAKPARCALISASSNALNCRDPLRQRGNGTRR